MGPLTRAGSAVHPSRRGAIARPSPRWYFDQVVREGLFNPSDPGVRLLAEAVRDVPPERLALVYSGPLPGVRPGATRWLLDVREGEGGAGEVLAGPDALPEPRFAAAAVWPRAHLGKDFTEASLAFAAASLIPGGRLFCAVRKDKGGPSLARTIAELLGAVETLARDRGYHLFAAVKGAGYDEAAAARRLGVRYEIAEPLLGDVPLVSAPGVFCRKHLDEGTRALLTAIQAADPPPPRRVLDLGAGIGPLGLWAARRWPTATVLAVESNAIAAGLIGENATRLGCAGRVTALLSDGLPAEHPQRGGIDLALVNPPTHAPAESFAELIAPLPAWMRADGEAWFVVNRSGRLVQVLGDTRAHLEAQEVMGYSVVRARWPRP